MRVHPDDSNAADVPAVAFCSLDGAKLDGAHTLCTLGILTSDLPAVLNEALISCLYVNFRGLVAQSALVLREGLMYQWVTRRLAGYLALSIAAPKRSQ